MGYGYCGGPEVVCGPCERVAELEVENARLNKMLEFRLKLHSMVLSKLSAENERLRVQLSEEREEAALMGQHIGGLDRWTDKLCAALEAADGCLEHEVGCARRTKPTAACDCVTSALQARIEAALEGDEA
jgi:hypothetical protein